MEPKPAPTTLSGIIRHLGPGLIITATIVGSGELIMTPKLAGEAGFKLLWFIIFGCLIKVFIQVELGRYAITHGKTTLAAMDSVPGPRFQFPWKTENSVITVQASWMVWFWVVMYIGSSLQIAGMMDGLASLVFQEPGTGHHLMILGVAAVTIILLLSGRYRLVERVCIGMVLLFTIFTIVALVALQFTEFKIVPSQIAEGFKFRMPEKFTTAFAAFPIIGVGTSELIYYPYWCLEKGYAKFTGKNDNTLGWLDRARGWLNVMKWDAWISCTIYTTATCAFFLLGAATLHRTGQEVGDIGMIATLSSMYEGAFGDTGVLLFKIGCFCVLFSTVFGATAANSRLFADCIPVFKIRKFDSEEDRAKWVKIGVIVLVGFSFLISLIFGEPVTLIIYGSIAQGALLPFLAIAAAYFLFMRIDKRLHPGMVWKFFLMLSVLAMVMVGCYQIYDKLK